MLSFFKKNKKEMLKKQGNDSVISSEELLNEEENTPEESEIYTELSLHPSMNVTTEQQYVLRFLNNDLPPLKPNQLSLAGIELRTEDDELIVSAFVRNSLAKSISLQKTTLLLIDEENNHLARKEFDLSELGEIPAKSSRPWNFSFSLSDVLTTTVPSTGWKLAFELKTNTEHRLDLDEAWENSLSDLDKNRLKELVAKMGPPKTGEVNFMGLQAKTAENGHLHVTMLIRNGSTNNIKIEQLPLQVEDASGETVAKGGFTLENFEVKANTSKPWTFIFPDSLLLKKELDLSKWKAYPIQNSSETTF